jgi:dienelactone hydrolase
VFFSAVLFSIAASGCAGDASGDAARDQPNADIARLPVITELPDPFVLDSGERISSPGQWPARREELKELFAYYEYGHLPPSPGNVTAAEIATESVYNGTTTKKVVRLSMGVAASIAFDVTVYAPIGAPGPLPAIVTGDLCWGSLQDKGGWGAGDFVGRGYVIAEFDRTVLAPDEPGAVGPLQAAYPSYAWAALAAWAWGYERVVDYLSSSSFVDASKIAVTGHSRGGKACLLAGAFDTRIAVTAPNASGCGGASAYRFAIGVPTAENLGAITSTFPHWFEPRLRAFSGQETRLPIDQHELVALVAPRAFLSTNALGDAWANPEGSARTQAAAAEVFGYLGARALVGINYRQGGHDQSREDWDALLDFCDVVLLGKPAARSFTSSPFADLPKGYSWSAP